MVIIILGALVLTSFALSFALNTVAPKLRREVRFLFATLISLSLFAIVALILIWIGAHAGA
jgi:hypothetical protein